jgi:plasmid stabilization system protein ParE
MADIFPYVAAQSDEAASRIADRIMAAGNNLALFPQIGRPSRLAGRRALVVDQYVLLYRLRRDNVQIIAVEHGARRR